MLPEQDTVVRIGHASCASWLSSAVSSEGALPAEAVCKWMHTECGRSLVQAVCQSAYSFCMRERQRRCTNCGGSTAFMVSKMLVIQQDALFTFLMQLGYELVIVHEAPWPTMDHEEWDGVWIVRRVVDVMQINLSNRKFELTKIKVEPCFLLRPIISAAPVSEEILHADSLLEACSRRHNETAQVLHLLKWNYLSHLQVRFRRALLPSHALLFIGKSRSLQPILQVPLVFFSNADTKRPWPRIFRHMSASKVSASAGLSFRLCEWKNSSGVKTHSQAGAQRCKCLADACKVSDPCLSHNRIQRCHFGAMILQ